MFRPTKLRRLSLCKCGFTVLHDHIRVGSVYYVDMDHPKTGFKMKCGGCGNILEVDVVMVQGNGASHGGILPMGIFQDVN